MDMTDWKLVDIFDNEPELSGEEIDDLDSGGLQLEVQNLHSKFWQQANHLKEVEDRHLQVLVSSGMIPEDHIANTEPSRRLDWFVVELNGRINPDGLSVPLQGLDIGDIEIYQITNEYDTQIKLKLTEKDGQELERIFNIPNDSSGASVQANFFNNRLYLRW